VLFAAGSLYNARHFWCVLCRKALPCVTDLRNLTIIGLKGRLNMLIDERKGGPTRQWLERASPTEPSSRNSKAKGSLVPDKSQQNPI